MKLQFSKKKNSEKAWKKKTTTTTTCLRLPAGPLSVLSWNPTIFWPVLSWNPMIRWFQSFFKYPEPRGSIVARNFVSNTWNERVLQRFNTRTPPPPRPPKQTGENLPTLGKQLLGSILSSPTKNPKSPKFLCSDKSEWVEHSVAAMPNYYYFFFSLLPHSLSSLSTWPSSLLRVLEEHIRIPASSSSSHAVPAVW